MAAMRRALHLAMQLWWLGLLIAAVLIAVLARPKAQPAPGDEAQVLAADEALGNAMRAGDKSVARKLLSLEFTFVDEDGKVHVRKAFLGGLKGVAAAPASDAAVKIYGLVAMVTGHRKTARGDDAFFLDVCAKQKRSWRALTMRNVVLGGADATSSAAAVAAPGGEAIPCRNPCQEIPYRVRSGAEQDLVNAFQSVEKATVAHDAGEYSKHIADEFVHYRSGRAPVPKAERIATIEEQKEHGIPAVLTAVQSMRVEVYGDGAAMMSTNAAPDDPEPALRIARVWVRRNDQWQMAISVQTSVKGP